MLFYEEYKNYDIIFIQETKIKNIQKIDLIQTHFRNFKLFWSPSVGRSAGLITLIRDKRILQITDSLICNNYIVVDITILKTKYRFINIYCPARIIPRLEVLKEIEFLFFSRRMFVMGGDFNFVPYTKQDKEGGIPKLGMQGQKIVGAYCKDFLLTDIWRVIYPRKKCFTWHGKRVKTRLDRFYVSQEMAKNVVSCRIKDNPFSDHREVKLEFLVDYNDEEKLWKCNPETFHEAEDDIIQAIETWDKTQEFWWDELKFEIKRILIKTTSEIEKKKNLQINIIRNTLENQLKNTEDAEVIAQTKKELISKIKEKAHGIFVRSRAKNYFEGERPTRIFLRQEKINGKAKIFDTLIVNGTEMHDAENIQNYIHGYYRNHFRKSQTQNTPNYSQFLNNVEPIDPEIAEKLDGPVSYTEILTAIKNLNNNSAPGSDGLTKEFYSYFRETLTPVLKEMVTDIIKNNELFPSQKYAIIKLIPKSDNPELCKNIKNLRPISLLNCDYKIFTKIITERMSAALKDKINAFQSCIPGRDITDNIHILRDVIDFSKYEQNTSMALFSNDYTSAFDTLSHEYIHTSLAAWGFGPGIRGIVKTLYSDAHSMLYTNKLTLPFPIERGIRQGDPLSMLLFAACLDPLLQNIQSNKYIQGFRMGPHQIKFIAHADDVNFFIRNQADIFSVRQTLKAFSEVSGLHPNADKCSLLNIGNSIIKQPGIKTVTEAKFLGMYVGKDGFTETNLKNLKSNIYKSTAFWDKKYLSVKGKICIANTILAPKLWYVLKVMPTRYTRIREFQRQIERYVWDRIIAPDVPFVYAPSQQGGLRLVNIREKITAFKTKIILDLIHRTKIWENFGKYWLGHNLRDKGEKFNTNRFLCRIPKRVEPADFYKTAFACYNETLKRINTIEKNDVKFIYKKLIVQKFRSYPLIENWQLFDSKLLSAKQEALNWKIFTQQIPVGEWLIQKRIVNSTEKGACAFCQRRETLDHLFIQCTHLATHMQDLFYRHFKFKIEGLNCHFPNVLTPKLNTKQITALSLYRDFIWQVRNRAVFDGVFQTREGMGTSFINYVNSRRQYGVLRYGSFPF